MSRIATMSTYNGYGAQSRIPRRAPTNTPTVGMQDGSASTKPSRLLQLQSDFQERRFREKEDKLIQQYEDGQTRALHRVGHHGTNGMVHGGNGMVRDFFREQRDQVDKTPNPSSRPTVDQLFKQRQMEYVRQNNTQDARGKNRISQVHSFKQHKSSAGRDRSNLLAPITRQDGGSSRPFPRKPQLVRPRTLKDISTNNERITPHEPIPKSAPTGMSALEHDGGNESDDSPPPNPKQLQQLQQKRKVLQRQKSKGSFRVNQNTSKTPNDFQKWQSEQDQAREERLARHRNKSRITNPSPHNDEGFEDDAQTKHRDDLKRQQEELVAQIEKQQRELLKLKDDRLRAEEQDAEDNKRRERAEEDMRRHRKEEDARRQRQDEEERMKVQWAEEKVRKIATEKKRIRKISDSKRRYAEDESDDDEELEQYMGKQPAPPEGPKPNHGRKVQSRITPSVFSRTRPSPSAQSAFRPTPSVQSIAHPAPSEEQGPPPSGAHTAIYDDADKLDGAYETLPELTSCYNCGRNFAIDRIDKHQKFCKNATTKRKVMDPTNTRTRGTDMAQYVRHSRKPPSPKPKKNNWRAQHDNFIQSIQYAKKLTKLEEEGGNIADLTPPPPTVNPDYVKCPYCTRNFNPQTAERHIPHCKNTKSRPAPPKRK